jgi:hypothetical protein
MGETMKWAMKMKEVLIAIQSGNPTIIPTDMDGTVHHSAALNPQVDCILIYHNATTLRLVDGSVCFRGNRLEIDVEIVKGREKGLVVRVTETSGEEQ